MKKKTEQKNIIEMLLKKYIGLKLHNETHKQKFHNAALFWFFLWLQIMKLVMMMMMVSKINKLQTQHTY